MANEDPNSIVTPQKILGTMFFGTAIALLLHGVTFCQMVWFFRRESGRSSKSMIAFVIFVWLAEAKNCAFMSLTTMNMFLLPAVTYAVKQTSPCSDWIARAQAIPETLCTSAVDGFFIMRVWRLSEHKKLTMLAFVPYLASYAFTFAQIVRSFQLRCDPNAVDISPMLIYAVYGCKIVFDGVVAATMCYMLYRRSSRSTRHANTIKVVRELILWSISTGVLMWIINLIFLLALSGSISVGYVIFFITGGIYVNAMLAQLNARARFRAMADESMPLGSIGLGEASSSSQPVDRELQLLDPARSNSQHVALDKQRP